MEDLTRLFYQHLASGKSNIPDPVQPPATGTLAKFEAIVAEIDNMSDAQCRIMLGEVMNLMIAQQKMLESLMRGRL